MILATVALVSCGDEKKEKETIRVGEEGTLERTTTTTTNTSRDTANTAAAQEGVTRQDGVVQIELTGDDQMRFNLKEIRVKEGETIQLTLRHIGQLPENAMGHNFVLLQEGTDVTDFAQRAATASGSDYIPEGDEVIVNTDMIGGGEETSIEFTAPEPGTYEFICSFPGHYVQMRGQFIVE